MLQYDTYVQIWFLAKLIEKQSLTKYTKQSGQLILHNNKQLVVL